MRSLTGSPIPSEHGIGSSLLAGERALYGEGDLRTARRCFDSAYREAERCDDGPAMARAALGLGGLWVHEHRTAADTAAVRVRQRHALSSIDPRSVLALRLRARLAAEEDYRTGGHAAVLAVVEEARSRGDAVALAEALSLAHHCVLGPGDGALRLELAQELIATASRTARRGDLLMGLLWRTVDLFLDADPHAGRGLAELRGLLADRDHLAAGFVADAIEVMLAIRGGGFAQAEARAAACAERGTTAGDVDGAVWHAGQLVAIRWYQGRVAELLPMLSELVNSPKLSAVDNSGFAALAVAAASAGDRRQAEGALARLRGPGLAGLSRSSSWLVAMYGAVEAAHLVGDAEISAQAYALLRPFARLPVMVSLGAACFGSVHHTLGVASLTCGDVGNAVAHLGAAIRDNTALGHWPAVTLSRWRLGQALRLRDGPRDEAAREEHAIAVRDAAELGVALPSEAGRRSVIHAGGSAGSGVSGEAAQVVIQRRGGRWRVEMGTRAVLVGHCVGMRHLAVLLANPGHEVPAIDLAAGMKVPTAGDVTPAHPLLDSTARQAYRERLVRLAAELDELDELGRIGGSERASALRAEQDWLITELGRATGLGGRARGFSSDHERARVSVGKAIRRALDRISEADPVIGDELRATVRTGARCCYCP
ncbi:hypothetical protein [Microtetraspora glauca]|uniref:Tetratricopeptide repeat protein n=1 Tax=Microtetraspora glauca TaxID=1996 RepID=A0ABV3GUJ1_MICGL